MAIEHVGKILNIDPAAVEQTILDKGGRKVGEKSMRRYVYDIVPGDTSRWIRLRDTGQEITLTDKELRSDAIDGTREVEVVVDSFEATSALLGMLGFTPKSYQENKRVSFLLDGAEVEIDTRPQIPTCLEIEAGSTGYTTRAMRAGAVLVSKHRRRTCPAAPGISSTGPPTPVLPTSAR